MKPPESVILLRKRCLRGCILFKLIALISLLFGGVAIVVPELRIWSGYAFFVAAMSLVGLHHVRHRHKLSVQVVLNTDAIYWVQPRATVGNLAAKAIAGKEVLRLFLSDGDFLEIEVSTDEMAYFKNWFAANSPQGYWGAQKILEPCHEATAKRDYNC
jgi:hypothetical protein